MKGPIPNIYKPGTQCHEVVEMLKEGARTGRDFLRAYLPEYRSRINTLSRDGYIIHREREENSKFVIFSVKGYAPLFKEAV